MTQGGGVDATQGSVDLSQTRATPATVWRFSKLVLALLPGRTVQALILGVSVSVTEGISLLLLLPLLQLAGVPVRSGSVGDVASLSRSMLSLVHLSSTLATVLVLYFVAAAAQIILRRQQQLATFQLQVTLAARLRQRLYLAIANADWLFFSRSRSSDFVHALTVQIDRVSNAAQSLIVMCTSALLILVYLAFALKLSVALTVLVLLSGVALLTVLRGKSAASGAAGDRITQATNDLYAAAMEHLSAMKMTKSYAVQARHTDLFDKLTSRIVMAGTGAMRNYTDVQLMFDIGSVGLLCIILYISLKVFALSTASILLLLLLFARIVPRFSSLQNLWQYFLTDLSAFVFVTRIQEACEASAEQIGSTERSIALRQEIQLAHVSFSYRQGTGRPVIADLDMHIPAGQTTAIVGPSGAGKSTIADMIIGLIHPDAGQVLIDDTPLDTDWMHSWRRQIGYVTQETFLFHDTVRANLLWASPDAREEDLLEALRLSAADAFVGALPKGLDTVVGERGVQLSGGERQRLALARALLRKPAVLVLDEATSAIDLENERRIQDAIDGLHGQLTIVIITHRLGTVQRADTIYFLDAGHVTEYGSWDALMGSEIGRFRAMSQAQGPSAALSL